MEELIQRLKRYSEKALIERTDPDYAAAIQEAIIILSMLYGMEKMREEGE